MMPCWAATMPLGEASSVASLRRHPGIEVCEVLENLWLRGAELSEVLEVALRSLPVMQYSVLSDGQLRRIDQRVPKGWLPHGPWQPLTAWMRLDLQSAAFPAQLPVPVRLQLERTQTVQEPNALVTEAGHWLAYATTASEIRFKPLRFAMAEDGRVLIHGRPVPPIPGQRCVESQGVCLPCGYGLVPAVEPTIVRRLLNAPTEQIVLFRSDGSLERLDAESFVAASRSAVRESAKERARG